MRRFYAAYGVLQKINTFSVWLSCVLIGLITLLTLWEVITRYFFRAPAMWTFPVTSYMLLYSIVLAAAYTLQKGGHVRVEVLLEVLPAGVQRWLERLSHLLGLAFVLIFLVQSGRHSTRALVEGARDVSSLSVPIWIPSVGMTVGLALMAITYLFLIVDSFVRPPQQPTIQDIEKSEIRTKLDTD